MTVPLERQIACIVREIAMRRRVYPRWVTAGTMLQAKADQEIADMTAVLATLKGLPEGHGEAQVAGPGISVMHTVQCDLPL